MVEQPMERGASTCSGGDGGPDELEEWRAERAAAEARLARAEAQVEVAEGRLRRAAILGRLYEVGQVRKDYLRRQQPAAAGALMAPPPGAMGPPVCPPPVGASGAHREAAAAARSEVMVDSHTIELTLSGTRIDLRETEGDPSARIEAAAGSLQEELARLKLSALQDRAVEEGVDPAAIIAVGETVISLTLFLRRD